jgi:ubiquinone/menaquinone biosynthesis C-methylase UbiE
MKKAKYLLESAKEGERLEGQALLPAYDPAIDLEWAELPRHGNVLDAGCGSGVAARYVASRRPNLEVVGIDASEERLRFAAGAAKGLKNLIFKNDDIRAMTQVASESVDLLVCRYVIQHIPQNVRSRVFGEFRRVLKPNGRLLLVDVDGIFENIHPRTALMDEVFSKVEASGAFDFRTGRKLATYLHDAGFKIQKSKTEAFEKNKFELGLMRERLELVRPMLEMLVSAKSDQFVEQFLNVLGSDGGTYFHTKISLLARKEQKLRLV